MDFPKELFLPQRTVFYNGAISQLFRECLEFGEKGLIVHGRSFEQTKAQEIIVSQDSQSPHIRFFCRIHHGEPILEEITQVISAAQIMNASWIAGIGGGSVIDLAKAAAGLYNAKEKPVFYQEGGRLLEKGIPFIAVPTTAGTGAEATPNAVITNKDKRNKLSIRDKSFLAKAVILDPHLLHGLPHSILSYAAMDAFVQAYEAFISKNATWLTDSFALKAIRLINGNIMPAYTSKNEDAFSSLLLGSYLAGIALSHARLGVIHGIAHPLGALYDFPHGLICAVCFVPSIQMNRAAMGEKYEIMSSAVGMDFEMRIQELLEYFHMVSPFKDRELIEKDKIIKDTLSSGSTAANPKLVEQGDVEYLLAKLF